MMTLVDDIFPLWSEMNAIWGSRMISVLEKEIQSNHKIESLTLRNNAD